MGALILIFTCASIKLWRGGLSEKKERMAVRNV